MRDSTSRLMHTRAPGCPVFIASSRSTASGAQSTRGTASETSGVEGEAALGVPVHLLARAKCSRVLENRGRLVRHLLLVPANPLSDLRLAQANLAVIGCQPPTQRMVVDVRESEWTTVDAPPTVLKTAGLVSASVRQRSPKFDHKNR
jgi:hypothetical protein